MSTPDLDFSTGQEDPKPETPTRKPTHRADLEPEGFSKFWEAYPRKSGVSKAAATKAFARVRPDADLLTAMLAALERHTRAYEASHSQQDGWRYFPHPATWLNQRRFNDGADAPSEASARRETRAERRKRVSDADFLDAIDSLRPDWVAPTAWKQFRDALPSETLVKMISNLSSTEQTHRLLSRLDGLSEGEQLDAIAQMFGAIAGHPERGVIDSECIRVDGSENELAF